MGILSDIILIIIGIMPVALMPLILYKATSFSKINRAEHELSSKDWLLLRIKYRRLLLGGIFLCFAVAIFLTVLLHFVIAWCFKCKTNTYLPYEFVTEDAITNLTLAAGGLSVVSSIPICNLFYIWLLGKKYDEYMIYSYLDFLGRNKDSPYAALAGQMKNPIVTFAIGFAAAIGTSFVWFAFATHWVVFTEKEIIDVRPLYETRSGYSNVQAIYKIETSGTRRDETPYYVVRFKGGFEFKTEPNTAREGTPASMMMTKVITRANVVMATVKHADELPIPLK